MLQRQKENVGKGSVANALWYCQHCHEPKSQHTVSAKKGRPYESIVGEFQVVILLLLVVKPQGGEAWAKISFLPEMVEARKAGTSHMIHIIPYADGKTMVSPTDFP